MHGILIDKLECVLVERFSVMSASAYSFWVRLTVCLQNPFICIATFCPEHGNRPFRDHEVYDHELLSRGGPMGFGVRGGGGIPPCG